MARDDLDKDKLEWVSMVYRLGGVKRTLIRRDGALFERFFIENEDVTRYVLAGIQGAHAGYHVAQRAVIPRDIAETIVVELKADETTAAKRSWWERLVKRLTPSSKDKEEPDA